MKILKKYCLPCSTNYKLIIEPVGPIFTNGLSKKYSTEKPLNLEEFMPEDEFNFII